MIIIPVRINPGQFKRFRDALYHRYPEWRRNSIIVRIQHDRHHGQVRLQPVSGYPLPRAAEMTALSVLRSLR